MTGINEVRERLMEQFDLRLGLEPALARPDDIRALLDDHARLQAQVDELMAQPIGRSDESANGKVANCDLLLALIDGSKAAYPDDQAVDAFAAALKAKLSDARDKGRGGWAGDEPGMQQRLSVMLREHVDKGDPRDVAAFCMFLHQRGEAISPKVSSTAQRIELTNGQISQLADFAGTPDPGTPMEDQDVLVILHCDKGHSGPGLYAYYDELPEEGAIHLDGEVQP